MYIHGVLMQEITVSKWGNSLAVRLPARFVAEMGLKDGDRILLRRADDETFEVAVKPTPREVLEHARAQLSRKLPADIKFDRDEANSRGPSDEG